MIEIHGKHNSAKVFTDELDGFSREQIENLCNQPFAEGSKIRLMSMPEPAVQSEQP
jgi:hypothetical protein